MRRFPIRTLVFVTSSLLALGAIGCDLPPKSVGDESTGTETGTDSLTETSASTTAATMDGFTSVDDNDSGGPSETSSTTGDVDIDEEVLHEWHERYYHRLIRGTDGVVLALGFHDTDCFITHFDPSGPELTSLVLGPPRYPEAFGTMADGRLAVGGSNRSGNPLKKEAFLLLLDEDTSETELILAPSESFVVEISGGETLWTLTTEKPSTDAPRWGVLRRHGSEGAVELTHPLLAPSSTLAVDPDGYAYTITNGDSRQLHRVAPDGGEEWSVSLEVEPTGSQVLIPRPGQAGVVLVSDVPRGRFVETMDGDGSVLSEFIVPAQASELQPAVDVGDAIVLAHPLPPDSYVVEARSADGTQLWSATRSVPGATQILIRDVLELPDGAVVIGETVHDSASFGFARFIVAP